jgi:sec-independent protein translocase protein TatA
MMMLGAGSLFALGLDPMTMMIVGVLAVLLFGGRLPEVARSLGKNLSELKKGLRDVEQELRSAMDVPTSSYTSTSSASITHTSYDQHVEIREEATAPKFEPPAADDVAATAATVSTAAGTKAPAD